MAHYFSYDYESLYKDLCESLIFYTVSNLLNLVFVLDSPFVKVRLFWLTVCIKDVLFSMK